MRTEFCRYELDQTNGCFPDMKTMFCDLDSNVSYQLQPNKDIISVSLCYGKNITLTEINCLMTSKRS
jgi:hypothetical protein